MTPTQIIHARELLGITQIELAKALGWTTRRNITNLENPDSGRKCKQQTAMAIECLLRRAELWDRYWEEAGKPDWFNGLNSRNQIALTQLKMFDLQEVEALVTDPDYQFPPGCNLGRRNQAEISEHIANYKAAL